MASEAGLLRIYLFGATRGESIALHLPNGNWKTVLDEHRPEDLESQFVKISHHGSTTGYCPGLWSILSAGRREKPLVALTPYKRFKLPDPMALDHIKDYSNAIYSASQRGHAPSGEHWRLVALAKLRSASSGRFPKATADASPGCCEVEVNDQGECRVILHPPARELSLAAIP